MKFKVLAVAAAVSFLAYAAGSAGPGLLFQAVFRASGTGAVDRTAVSKMREVISVKDFGAKGDNSTNDTAAINAAILAAVNSQTFGACVYLPAGRYVITDTIKMYNTGTGFTADGLCLYGDGPLATLIRWNTTDATKAAVRMHGAQQRFDNIAVELLGDALTAIAYDGDSVIGRSTGGHIGNVHVNCSHHSGDGIQIAKGNGQADLLEIDHPLIESCDVFGANSGSAIHTYSDNAVTVVVINPFLNNDSLGFNFESSTDTFVYGGEYDDLDLIVRGNNGNPMEFYGGRAEGPKRVYFDGGGSSRRPFKLDGFRVDQIDVTRPSATASVSAGTNTVTLSVAGYTFGDVITLPGAGAAGAEIKVTISGMTSPTNVTFGGSATTTITNQAIGFYGYNFAGARCTVATTNTSTTVVFSSPWCQLVGEFITVVGAGLTARQITSCADSTTCTVSAAATATLPTATWFNAGATTTPNQPQSAFQFNQCGPYVIADSSFGAANAQTVVPSNTCASVTIRDSFWEQDPGNLNPMSSPQLAVLPGLKLSGNVFGTTVSPPTMGNSAFANLPTAPPNGSFQYCTDCTVASPCAGGGTGAFAKRIASAWVCN